jgi:hypothetical protein
VEFNTVIDTLVKFKYVDKYESFHKLQPGVLHAGPQEKQVVSSILDECCSALIKLLENAAKFPRAELKRALVMAMDELSHADIQPDNREFGYQLGWYLAEKAGIDLHKVSARKVWGFWAVDADEVKSVKAPARKKKIQGPSNEITPTR